MLSFSNLSFKARLHCRTCQPRPKGACYSFVIPQLLSFAAMRSQNLRAWMVNGNEQTPAPNMYLTDRFLERQMMILNASERIKRDRAERDDDWRWYQTKPAA